MLPAGATRTECVWTSSIRRVSTSRVANDESSVCVCVCVCVSYAAGNSSAKGAPRTLPTIPAVIVKAEVPSPEAIGVVPSQQQQASGKSSKHKRSKESRSDKPGQDDREGKRQRQGGDNAVYGGEGDHGAGEQGGGGGGGGGVGEMQGLSATAREAAERLRRHLDRSKRPQSQQTASGAAAAASTGGCDGQPAAAVAQQPQQSGTAQQPAPSTSQPQQEPQHPKHSQALIPSQSAQAPRQQAANTAAQLPQLGPAQGGKRPLAAAAHPQPQPVVKVEPGTEQGVQSVVVPRVWPVAPREAGEELCPELRRAILSVLHRDTSVTRQDDSGEQ